MTQLTPEEALRRSRDAERLFNDPTLKETLDFIEKEVMEMWMACPVRDAEAREALWRMAVTARKFRDLLRGTMESGKLAAEHIQQKESAASFKDRALKAVQSFKGY